MNLRNIIVIGAACGYGAMRHDCQDGPEVLRAFGFLDQLDHAGVIYHWDEILHLPEDATRTPLASVVMLCEALALKVATQMQSGHFPLVLGGDHSCAIGTWSGVRRRLPEEGSLGLLWIDAHMDSHTDATTPSHAIHGMPLACLLGYGDECLTHLVTPQAKLLPEHVCLIGTRSFEAAEAKLLQRLGVRIFYMDEILRRGMDIVWQEALDIVQSQTTGFGISLDLDVLDPQEETGVGSPVPGGLLKNRLIEMLVGLKINPNFLAMEIVEYNPYLDTNFTTASAISELVAAITSDD